jgi:glycosyltransferase involved in cell wall biosynthesis
MHILFIHPSFPAQFGHLAAQLSTGFGWHCSFLTSVDTTHLQLPFDHWNYHVKPGPLPTVYRSDRTAMEPFVHMAAIFQGLRSTPQIQPDLIVGHTYFGSLFFLRQLYKCPMVGYFEWLPPPYWTDEFALRPDFGPNEEERLAAAAGHVMNYRLLHLIDAAYTPTHFQRETAPPELKHKIEVIHDGIDTEFFRRRTLSRDVPFHNVRIGPNTKVVTYASPGLEAWRGFDIFMQVADRLSREFDDIVFLIAGEDLTQYGHEGRAVSPGTFKQYVLSRGNYDLSNFHFLGRITPNELVSLFSLSDVHVYLTVPFVVSWSLLQAMSTECTIVASKTPPVVEVCEDEKHGLLADFYDAEGLAARASQALRDPQRSRQLGAAARAQVLERYEQRHCLRKLVTFFEDVARRGGAAGLS